jgi:hypothetical protein
MSRAKELQARVHRNKRVAVRSEHALVRDIAAAEQLKGSEKRERQAELRSRATRLGCSFRIPPSWDRHEPMY